MPIRVRTPQGVVEFPDGTPPEEIKAALDSMPVNLGSRASFTVNNQPVSNLGPAPPGMGGGVPFSPEEFTPRPDWDSPSVMDSVPTVIARGSRMLPAVGGAIGGSIGAPAGPVAMVGGAALGGAAGEAGSQLIRRALGRGGPDMPVQAATDILQESALQVPMELGGRALMAGGRVLGRTLYDAALRPTNTLLQEFPDVVGTALRERLPVGDLIPGVTRKGSAIANEARQASSRKTAQLLEQAGTRGVRFTIRDVIEKPVQSLAKQLDTQPEMRSDLATLGKFTRDLLEDKAGGITPLRLKAIKQSAQAVANPIYKAQARGNTVTAAQSLSARANRAVATGAKDALETVGGVADSESKTQALIGAARAIRQAEARRAPLTTHILSGVAGSAGVGGGIGMGGGPKDDAMLGLTMYMLMRVAASPRTLSRAGITLTRQGVQEVLRLLPYASEGMYQATRPLGTTPTQRTPTLPIESK